MLEFICIVHAEFVHIDERHGRVTEEEDLGSGEVLERIGYTRGLVERSRVLVVCQVVLCRTRRKGLRVAGAVTVRSYLTITVVRRL